jgi:uncharacterized membrane protein HdeD (DUF308 family)
MAAIAGAVRRLESVWWLVLLNGIAKLVLGLLLVTDPGMTLTVLVQFLGAYWLVSGIFAIVGIFVQESKAGWVWNLIAGLIGVLAGIAVLNHPMLSGIFVSSVIASWLAIMAIIVGAIRIMQALRGDGWAMGVWGVVNVIFGLLLLQNPFGGAQALAMVIGVFAIVGGAYVIWAAFRVRGAVSGR